MQKKNLKASILIWAIFMSLIISVTFISISTKINKNLKNNSNFTDNIIIGNEIKNIIASGSFDDQILSNGDEIIFDKNNEITLSLKQNEKYIAKINNSSNIGINIINGGPVKYRNLTNSGLINTNNTINTDAGDLEIENLGGYTKIEITSNYQNDYLSQYTNYKIIKKIGNKELIKTRGRIKNF